MPKMLQVRNLPDPVHAELVRRARRSGRTLTDFVQAILEREVARPPLDEVLARLHGREAVDLGRPAAELLAEERGRRMR